MLAMMLKFFVGTYVLLQVNILKDLYFGTKLTDLSSTIQVSVIFKNTLENLFHVLWI